MLLCWLKVLISNIEFSYIVKSNIMAVEVCNPEPCVRNLGKLYYRYLPELPQ